MTANKKVLIIEDHVEIRESTAEILELTGHYHVLTAAHGREGVDLALAQVPDLILCDIMMPELDGYGVLYMLGKYPATKNIPFIFLTARTERADIRKAMEMGADDYLTKPFDDVELLNAIDVRLKKRAQFSDKVVAEQKDDFAQELLLDQMVGEARIKRVKKKQMLYEVGDIPYFIYYVLKGKVRTFLSYVDGRELSTAILTEQQLFGYESPLLNTVYSDNAVALEDVEVALLPKEAFFEMMYRKPALAAQVIRMLSGNVQLKEKQMLGFAYDTVRKRVANALIEVAEKTAPQQDQCIIRISREDLAALAGTANETISRMLADFKDEKLISKDGNAIVITSVRQLQRIKQ
ncbi:response regulator [Sphingobacterium sp. lm-10]|uniref:response regulator n=1 Tax=Sphingobacterium sp. lm-10 TaxID=2944904 RepID=UPI0020212409|nr:response regulator [Sphingobacterium sp. lm-10]MCL7989340.1 response regulator [Sphingobacterium sp. lm-10]